MLQFPSEQLAVDQEEEVPACLQTQVWADRKFRERGSLGSGGDAAMEGGLAWLGMAWRAGSSRLHWKAESALHGRRIIPS